MLLSPISPVLFSRTHCPGGLQVLQKKLRKAQLSSQTKGHKGASPSQGSRAHTGHPGRLQKRCRKEGMAGACRTNVGPGMTQDRRQPSLSLETSKFPATPPSSWPPGGLARCTRRCPALRSVAPRRSTGKQFSPLGLPQVAGGPQQSCWEKPPAPPRAPRCPVHEFKGAENRGQATNHPQQLLPQDKDRSGSPSRSHAAWGWGGQPAHPHPHPHPHHGCRPRRRADSSQDAGRSHPLLCPSPGGPPSSAQPPGK